MTDGPDRWYRWLLDVRFGGDAAYRVKELTESLYPVRDTVLDKAQLMPGETLLDVGAGDGLIAFGALERLGPSGRVISPLPLSAACVSTVTGGALSAAPEDAARQLATAPDVAAPQPEPATAMDTLNTMAAAHGRSRIDLPRADNSV